MLSDRVQRQVDRLLDQAEEAIALRHWEDLRATCEVVLNLDPENSDATRYLALADKSLATDAVSGSSDILESVPVSETIRGWAGLVEHSEDPTPESVVDMSLAIDRNLNPRGYAVAGTSQSQDRKESTPTSAPGVTSPACGAPQPGTTPSAGVSPKGFVPALVLCILLGGLGVHRFYLGKPISGIFMILTLGGFGIWTLIDLIRIAVGSFNDGDGLPVKSS